MRPVIGALSSLRYEIAIIYGRIIAVRPSIVPNSSGLGKHNDSIARVICRPAIKNDSGAIL
jgi:hypothetical protein